MQHVANFDRMACLQHPHAAQLLGGLEHGHRDEFTIAAKYAVSVGQLKQAGRQAVAVAHGGLLDRPPGFVGAQFTADCSWEGQLGFLPESDLREHGPHVARLHLHGHLDCAHVTGLLDHLVDSQHPVGMGVADGRVANIHAPGGGLYLCLGLDQALLQRQCDHEGLHGGARLKAVGQGAVTQLLAAEVLPPRGRIARVIGQRQHLATLHIEHHHAARLGFILQHRFTQFLISKELHLAVNTELDVAPVHWRNILAHRLHHPATAVLDDPARTSASGQVLVESQLNALLPAIINIGEAHHMGSGFTLRVQTLVFLALVNAPDA